MSVFYFTPPPPFNEWGAENERVSGPVRKLPSTIHLELSPVSPEKTLWMNRCAPNSKLGPNHKQETRDTTNRNVLSLPLDMRRTLSRRLHWPKRGATGGLDPGSFWLASLLQGSRCSSGNYLRYRCPSSLKSTQISSLLEEASQDSKSNLYSCLCSGNQSG